MNMYQYSKSWAKNLTKRLIILLLVISLLGSSCSFFEAPPDTSYDWHIAINRIITSLRALPTVVELMQYDDTCYLPCLWGLYPGQTTTAEVQEFMNEHFEGIFNGKVVHLHLSRWKGISFLVDFNVDDNILRYIDISVKPPLLSSNISLPFILSHMNSIPDIYIDLNISTGIFGIDIVYNDQGVMASYTFSGGPNLFSKEPDHLFDINVPMVICPQFEQNTFIKIWLQSDWEKLSVQERIRPNLQASDFYKPLQDVIDIGPEEFIERIISDPDVCFEALPYNEVY